MAAQRLISAKANVDMVSAVAKVRALTPEQKFWALRWYEMAHKQVWFTAKQLDVDPVTFAAVVAVISPGREWMDNVKDAITLVTWYQSGRHWSDCPIAVSYSKDGVRKAWMILRHNDTDLVSGPKVRPFFLTLVNPAHNEVTVDYHIGNVFTGGRGSAKVSEPFRRKAVAVIRLLAAACNVPATSMQALLWQAQKQSLLES